MGVQIPSSIYASLTTEGKAGCCRRDRPRAVFAHLRIISGFLIGFFLLALRSFRVSVRFGRSSEESLALSRLADIARYLQLLESASLTAHGSGSGRLHFPLNSSAAAPNATADGKAFAIFLARPISPVAPQEYFRPVQECPACGTHFPNY